MHVLRVCNFLSFSIPGSSSQCKPETIQYNVTITRGIFLGDYLYLGEVSNITECIELACNKSNGELAFQLDDRCFLVKCDTTCKLFKAPDAASAAARLNRTGRASIKAKTLNVTSF